MKTPVKRKFIDENQSASLATPATAISLSPFDQSKSKPSSFLKNNLAKTHYEDLDSQLFSSPVAKRKAEPDSSLLKPCDSALFPEAETPLTKIIGNRNAGSIFEDSPLHVITNSIVQQKRIGGKSIPRLATNLPKSHGPQSIISKLPVKDF